MNIDQITQAVVAAYPSRQPLMVWGPPGVGKSEGIGAAVPILGQMLKESAQAEKTRALKKMVADSLGFGFIDLRLSLLDPVDLRGIPFPVEKEGVVRWMRPGFLPTSGAGILCLDEIVEASHSMQGAASQLILNRRIGDYVLPEGWMVVGAGNEMSHRASSRGMPTQIANRFVHLTAEVNVDAWIRWALKNGVDMRVIAFIKFREKLLHNFDPTDKGHAFASPRSWVFASNLLKTFTGNRGLLLPLMKGCVGDGPGGEFTAFAETFNELHGLVDTILLNPATAVIPQNPGVLFVLSNTLANRATKDNLPSIVKYLDRISDTGHPEYAVAAMKEVSAKDGSTLAKTRTFVEWASRHNHILS